MIPRDIASQVRAALHSTAHTYEEARDAKWDLATDAPIIVSYSRRAQQVRVYLDVPDTTRTVVWLGVHRRDCLDVALSLAETLGATSRDLDAESQVAA